MQIDFQTAKEMIKAANQPGEAKSVFFNLGDLKQALVAAGLGAQVAANPDNYGIKIYFAKYDINNRIIKTYVENFVIPALGGSLNDFSEVSTVIIQLMDGTNSNFITYNNGSVQYMAVNLGSACPPKCGTALEVYI